MIDPGRWQQLLSCEPGQRGASAEAVREGLVEADFSFLATMLASPDAAEVESALLVLDAGVIPSGRTMSQALAVELSRLVREHYPEGIIGSTALRLWRLVDRLAADRFIEMEFDFSNIAGVAAGRAVLDLSVSRGPHAHGRLRELARRSDDVGTEARRRLELLAPSDERIENLRSAWLSERTTAALTALYYAVGTRIAWGRTTRKEIIAIFGEPDRRDGVSIWYEPNPGFSVSYQFDGGGRVIGSHLT